MIKKEDLEHVYWVLNEICTHLQDDNVPKAAFTLGRASYQIKQMLEILDQDNEEKDENESDGCSCCY